ncbi:hypothetical protein Gohar_026821, partial [Gossypium harknessii]|nr:hypothetical protein [Gossypium harknessii]
VNVGKRRAWKRLAPSLAAAGVCWRLFSFRVSGVFCFWAVGLLGFGLLVGKRFQLDTLSYSVSKTFLAKRVFSNGYLTMGEFQRLLPPPPTVKNQILEAYIRNLFAPPSTLIELYLRDALKLLMDGLVVTGSVVSTDWKVICGQLLRKDNRRSSNARQITKSCTFKVAATTRGLKRSRPNQLGINSVDDIVESRVELCGTTGGVLRYTAPFRHHDKSYLLLEEARHRQLHSRRPRQPPRNPRSGAGAKTSPSSALMQKEAPSSAPPPSYILQPDDFDLFAVSDVSTDDFCATEDISPIFYVTCVWDTIHLQTPRASLFYQGGSSSQAPIPRTGERRWQRKSTSHSTTDERDEDEREKETRLAIDEDEEEEEELEPQLVRKRNSSCN